jgi:putative Mg2+ transporter-C (MgtC) family protein
LSVTYFLPPDDLLGIIFRLSLALLVGAIIGLDRQLRHKPAGLRTHMLVSFGSALFVLVPLQMSMAKPDYDPISRVIQGVAAGVGFLGGGEILRSPNKESGQEEIHGLTSAAAIWVSAALGITAGCGLWQMALIGGLLSFLVLRFIKKLERFG